MHIERIQVDEGFLDGLDVNLVPGLNVLIGARGTGKTSLIELVRFCLNVPSYTREAGKRSREHALSVLGTGQVTLTLRDREQKITISRTATDQAPRTTGAVAAPIIFSQTEIETVGLQAGGRLRLLDGFAADRRQSDVKEAEATSAVRSLSTEANGVRREIEEFHQQIAGLKALDERLAQLAPKEQELAKISAEAAAKKKALDALAASITVGSIAADAIDRFSRGVARWRQAIDGSASSSPSAEKWPGGGGEDPLTDARSSVERAKGHISNALKELDAAQSEVARVATGINQRKTTIDEQARQLRREIESLQSGAGAVAREGQQLREKKGQLESLRTVANERAKELASLLTRRAAALDALDAAREQRFKAREAAAARLNKTLGPRIHVAVERAGQFDAFASAIAEALRGSGMRYNDLGPVLARNLSPRELLEAADANDFDLLAEASGISKDRAARVLAQLKEADLGSLASIAVEDAVSFQLLDGADYKEIGELSTGQRCTVILPLVLQHVERMLLVDQPEDHIDNAFIADTLVKSVLARDPAGQIIFATHNANLPVLGDADRVIHLGSDGRRAFVLTAAPLEDKTIVAAITTVMEGGAYAFERRASFYGRHKRN